jgi:hypothetical protein
MSVISAFPLHLRTSRRDIRIAPGTFSARRFRSGADTLGFAETLLKRYIDRGWLEPIHSYVLRKVRIGIAIQHLHRHQQVNIAPRLALTVRTWNVHLSPNPFTPIESLSRMQQETQRIRTVTQRRETHFAEHLVEQIVARKRRLEMNAVFSLTFPSVPRLPEVKRVVRREAHIIEDQPVSTPVAEQTIDRRMPERKTNNEIHRGVEAPMDLNRLTDQIIQTIDRRIIAQRERLGRV